MSPGPFSIARLPRIEFGAGTIGKLPDIAAAYGKRVLLVTGAASFVKGPHWKPLCAALKNRGIGWEQVRVSGEPSPELVDQAARQFRAAKIDAVIGIGGGSALDAGKAIAGLLKVNHSVMDFLEGVGPELPYPGPAIPFIAVPTTAGTGSEAAKNAVLSIGGAQAFKKSFRHDQLVAQYAIVDPDLLTSCPPELIAANGMDAITQLLESFVSLRANAFTDPLALAGLRAARDSLLPWFEQGADADPHCRAGMAYAALLSGVALAQTGLGSVHGLASPLGALFPIPHGAACGTLVARATEINIAVMEEREPENPALERYARAGDLLCGCKHMTPTLSRRELVELLYAWTAELKLAPLGKYGVAETDLERIVAQSRGSSMKTNPVVLSDEELRDVLRPCLLHDRQPVSRGKEIFQ
jgi:alcohol dehydrogenase